MEDMIEGKSSRGEEEKLDEARQKLQGVFFLYYLK